MIKRIYIKKILISSIALFAFFLIYCIPNNKTNNFSVKQEIEYVNVDVNTSPVYLLDSNNYLAKTEIAVSDKSILEKASDLITALIKGEAMEDKIPNGFKAIIPAGTKIKSLDYKDNLIKINFSKDLLDTNKENEEKVIEAIVYTLTSIDGVDKIIIMI